jgi:maleate isomerase
MTGSARRNADRLGWRKKLAVLGPSTNTIVQPEMEEMRPRGVTNHYSRIFTPNSKAISDETFMAGTLKISEGTAAAVDSAMTMEPDWMVLGMSAVTFYGGLKGAEKFHAEISARTNGVGVTTGALASAEALRRLGVKRLSFLSPYYPVANAEVRRFFTDCGFEVKKDVPLRAPSWLGIAEITEKTLVKTIREIDGDDVDGILQVGTNCCMARLAAEAEKWLGKPVVAINTATYWHALRHCGVDDEVDGFGTLLRDH